MPATGPKATGGPATIPTKRARRLRRVRSVYRPVTRDVVARMVGI